MGIRTLGVPLKGATFRLSTDSRSTRPIRGELLQHGNSAAGGARLATRSAGLHLAIDVSLQGNRELRTRSFGR